MTYQKLFSKGFTTNRIPIVVPSSGRSILLRETTVLELKSICKTIIDNVGRRQMDVIYDSITDYLQAMILTDDVDVLQFTEFDRLFCMMIFFQMSFYTDPIQYKCPHCGVDINYRYDMSGYLSKMQDAYVEDQEVTIDYKSKKFHFNIGWPNVKTMSNMTNHFYQELGPVTDEMEQTQYGINFVLSFIKSVNVSNKYDETDSMTVDLFELSWQDRLDIINSLPSMVVFDANTGILNKIIGYFINRLENCFSSEMCPQCHKDTYYGVSQSSHFWGILYGSLKSLYGYILQIECLLVYRYSCCIHDKEQYMTFNDLNGLVKQLGVTMENEEKERRKVGQEPLTKGLWYIREILNTMIFPQDKKR